MKNTVRTTAAILAAIIAMSCTSVTAFADNTTDAALDETAYTDMIIGGWAVTDSPVSMSKNPDAKAAFKKATKDYAGWSFKALAVLGTQVVAGTNYAILVKADELNPDGGPTLIKIMYIYEDLQGNAEITGFKTIIGEQLMGGFTANSGNFTPSKNTTAYNTYKKTMKGLTGVSYKPVAYLGSQVVAGTNYMFLCRSQVVYPGAPYQWSLVTVNSDLEGKSSLVDIETLTIGDTDEENAAIADDTRNKVFLIAVEAGTDEKKIKKAFKKYDLEVIYDYDNFDMYAVSVPEPLNKAESYEFAQKLMTDYKFIISVEPDQVMQLDDETADTQVSIANPWTEYKTVSAAAKAAGVSFTAPQKIGKYEISYIQAMDGLAEVDYSNGSNTILVRKGKGTDDVSGDWNDYKSVTEKELNGQKVTLKGNGKGVMTAVWTDGTNAYSISSEKALTEKSIGVIMGKIA